ncbi:MAG: NAD(P)/FAD-dependent oxidoreductase [Planctomycetota bacterium]
MKAKVVVVGGGVMGVSIAWQAALRSNPGEHPIVLLEKTALAAGSSGRSGAILRQFYSQREVAGMARDSLAVYAGFERRTGRRIGFQRSGVITLVGPGDPEGAALVDRNVEMMLGIGIDVRRLDAAAIRRLVPGIEVRDGSMAAYEPGGAAVDPVATVEAFAALARENGAVTRLGNAVRGFLRSGSRVVGVETDEGPVEAETVVVAAGPWARKLLLRAGIDLPLRAVRPEQHFLEGPPSRLTAAPSRPGTEEWLRDPEELEPAEHPVLLDLEHAFYARIEMHPSREGLVAPRTRIGGMDLSRDADVPDPDDLDPNVSDEFRSWARSRLESRMPEYTKRRDVGSLVGMYTLSPDSQALIGPIEGAPGLLVVAGFSGHGFKLAPSVGEGVAQMLAREPVSAFDSGFFSPGRFHAGRESARGRGFGL